MGGESVKLGAAPGTVTTPVAASAGRHFWAIISMRKRIQVRKPLGRAALTFELLHRPGEPAGVEQQFP